MKRVFYMFDLRLFSALFLAVTLAIFTGFASPAFCADEKSNDNFLDNSYSFIDTAFDGVKPVTDKQFNDVIQSKTYEKPTTFWGKVRTFFLGAKQAKAPNTNAQQKEVDLSGELGAIQKIENPSATIAIASPIYAVDGGVIPVGHYKINRTREDKQEYINFWQSSKNYGKIKASQIDDNKNGKNDIIYAQVDPLYDNVLRILYSDLEKSVCGFAQIAK